MILAQYRSVCSECTQMIEPNQPIEVWGPNSEGWAHVQCPDVPSDALDAEALAKPRCARCCLNHPGEC